MGARFISVVGLSICTLGCSPDQVVAASVDYGGGALMQRLELQEPRGSKNPQCTRLNDLSVTVNGAAVKKVQVLYGCDWHGENCSCSGLWQQEGLTPQRTQDGLVHVAAGTAQLDYPDPRNSQAPSLPGGAIIRRGEEFVIDAAPLLAPCSQGEVYGFGLVLQARGQWQGGNLTCGAQGCSGVNLSGSWSGTELRFALPAELPTGPLSIPLGYNCRPQLTRCDFTGGCSATFSAGRTLDITVE